VVVLEAQITETVVEPPAVVVAAVAEAPRKASMVV
jgi:hypothetical protein